tara:strand:+ start:456 stop:686 length:231 start_codon:yes stop_codon:yes gene_type:complete
MAYKQKYTKSAFPFKSTGASFSESFDKAFNATAKSNNVKKTVENSEVKEVQKINGLDCPTFGGGPRQYDSNGLVKK